MPTLMSWQTLKGKQVNCVYVIGKNVELRYRAMIRNPYIDPTTIRVREISNEEVIRLGLRVSDLKKKPRYVGDLDVEEAKEEHASIIWKR